MLDSVAPTRPGWRRHAPIVLYAIAFTALAVALARPEATVPVPDSRASVMLTTDISGSMQARDVKPTRLAAARRARARLPRPGARRAAGGHGHLQPPVRSIEAPTTDRARACSRPCAGCAPAAEPPPGTRSRCPSTCSTARAPTGADARPRRPGAPLRRRRHPRAATRPAWPSARSHRIPIYTVALGTETARSRCARPAARPCARPCPPTARPCASSPRPPAGATTRPPTTPAQRDLRAPRQGGRANRAAGDHGAFAGAALLLLFGGAMSLRWFGRLP